MSAHTPGPWEYDAETEEVFRVLEGGKRDESIALVDRSHEDGKLIAASPDLLVSVQELMAWAGELNVRISQKEQHAGLAVFKRAKIAIAKAGGR